MKRNVTDAVRELLGGRVIAVPVKLVPVCGSLHAAVMCRQILWWQGTVGRAFYKTREQWEEETGLTRAQQQTARKQLKERGILSETKRGVPCRVFYEVDVEILTLKLAESYNPPEEPEEAICPVAEIEQTSLREPGQLDGAVQANRTERIEQTRRSGSSHLHQKMTQKKTQKKNTGGGVLFPSVDVDADTQAEVLLKAGGRELTAYGLEHFEAWWRVYPLRKGKGQAAKAWAKACARVGGVRELHRLTVAWAEREHSWRSSAHPGAFVPSYPHPTTWLNGDRWTDEHREPEAEREADWKAQARLRHEATERMLEEQSR